MRTVNRISSSSRTHVQLSTRNQKSEKGTKSKIEFLETPLKDPFDMAPSPLVYQFAIEINVGQRFLADRLIYLIRINDNIKKYYCRSLGRS